MMPSAGYSGTPLARKLGITETSRVGLIGGPTGFQDRLDAPPGAHLSTRLRGTFDVVVFFTRRRVELERRLPALQRALRPTGGLWIAWPKRSSGVDTDLGENTLRDVILPTGLVDNKVCAVDDTWSGLRFVVRLADRPSRSAQALVPARSAATGLSTLPTPRVARPEISV